VVWAPDTFTCNCWALQGHSSSFEGFSIAVCFLHRAACQAQFHAQQVAISHNRLSKTIASMLLCPLVAPDPGKFPHQNQGGLAAPCVCVERVLKGCTRPRMLPCRQRLCVPSGQQWMCVL
jgi:hypothetical protein